MKRLTILFCICFMALEANCAIKPEGDVEVQTDSATLLNSYLQIIETLARERDSLSTVSTYSVPNAYYFQLLTHPTLYNSPLHQMMSEADSTTNDMQLQRLFSMRNAGGFSRIGFSADGNYAVGLTEGNGAVTGELWQNENALLEAARRFVSGR